MNEVFENYEYVKNLIVGYATEKNLPVSEVERRVQANLDRDTAEESINEGVSIWVSGEEEFIPYHMFIDYKSVSPLSFELEVTPV